MRIIPLQAVPSQIETVTLGIQICKVKVYQKSTGMFLDLYLNDVLICGGVLCEDRNRLVRAAYSGFVGDLAFLDTQGTTDPVYTGFGPTGRYSLAYLDAADVAAVELARATALLEAA